MAVYPIAIPTIKLVYIEDSVRYPPIECTHRSSTKIVTLEEIKRTKATRIIITPTMANTTIAQMVTYVDEYNYIRYSTRSQMMRAIKRIDEIKYPTIIETLSIHKLGYPEWIINSSVRIKSIIVRSVDRIFKLSTDLLLELLPKLIINIKFDNLNVIMSSSTNQYDIQNIISLSNDARTASDALSKSSVNRWVSYKQSYNSNTMKMDIMKPCIQRMKRCNTKVRATLSNNLLKNMRDLCSSISKMEIR